MTSSVLSEIVTWRDVELVDEPSAARPGSISKAQDFIDRDRGVAFRILTSEHTEDFFSPRHHHTFDQVRFVISGVSQYGKSHSYERGDLLFIPGGAWYGPMHQTDATEGFKHFTMQFKGTSELPYYGPAEFEAARSELVGQGHFEKGLFHWNDGRRQDGWEAQLQQVVGHEITYPEPPFEEYVAVRSHRIPWREAPGAPGVQLKYLGHFTDVGPRARLVKLAAGAELPGGAAAHQQVMCLFSGTAEFDEQPGVTHEETTFRYIPPNVPFGPVRGVEEAELLIVEWAVEGELMAPQAV